MTLKVFKDSSIRLDCFKSIPVKLPDLYSYLIYDFFALAFESIEFRLSDPVIFLQLLFGFLSSSSKHISMKKKFLWI